MSKWQWLSDERIVRRVLAGRTEDFGILVERYLPMVRAVAFARTGSPHDTDDVTQDTFLNAFKSLDRLQSAGRFRAWLMSIARNACTDFLRSRDKPRSLEPREVAGTAPDASAGEMRELIRHAVDGLDVDYREVLWLYYYAGRNTREIAATLGVPMETVKKRLQRARDALGVRLAGQVEEALHPEHDTKERASKLKAVLMGVPVPWRGAASNTGSGASLASPGGVAWAKVTAVVFAGALVIGAGVWLANSHDPVATGPAMSVADTADTSSPMVAPAPSNSDPPQAAQVTPAVAPPNPPIATIIGRVIDAVNGEPVKAFQVARREWPPRGPIQDGVKLIDEHAYEDGMFEYPLVEHGQVTLVAWAEGFAHAVAQAYLAPDQTVPVPQNIVIELTRGGSVSGRVLDATTRRPVANAVVDVFREPPMNATNEESALLIFSPTRTVSDAQGRYRIGHVPAGQSYVLAWHEEYPRAGAPVQVTAERETSGQTLFLEKGTATIWGYVTYGGKPAAGAVVEDTRAPKPRQTVVGEDGYYQMTGLSPENIILFAIQTHDGVERRKLLSANLAPNEERRLDFELAGGTAVLEGTVYDHGVPAPKAAVTASPAWADLDSGGVVGGGHQQEFTTGDDGRFRFEDIAEGDWNVEAFVSRQDSEGMTLDEGHAMACVQLNAGATRSVDLCYGVTGTGRIHGAVGGTEPILPMKAVELRSVTLNGEHITHIRRLCRIGAGRTFEFSGLPEATYLCEYKQENPQATYQQVVRLGDASTVWVDLPSTGPKGSVAGTITGAGIEGPAYLQLIPLEVDARISQSVEANVNSGYRIDDVPPGRYKLECRTEGWMAAREIVVESGREMLVEFMFGDGTGAVEVSFLRRGEPISGEARLELTNVAGSVTGIGPLVSGAMRLDRVTPGSYVLSGVVDGDVHDRPVTVEADRTTTVVLEMEPGETPPCIEGTVYTNNLWGAYVCVREPGYPAPEIFSSRQLMTTVLPGTVLTDRTMENVSHEYRFAELAPGSYEVLAVWFVHSSVPLEYRVRTYAVEVAEGHTVELDINMND